MEHSGSSKEKKIKNVMALSLCFLAFYALKTGIVLIGANIV